MFLAMVYARDGAKRVGLEDTILRTPKDVTAVNDVGSNTRLLRDMMGENRQDVLMGSILLYTTMKIPTIT